MNCKPGDLAFIVQDEPRCGDANIGRIVRVLDEPAPMLSGLHNWCVEADSPLLVAHVDYKDYQYAHHRAWHPDAWLRPIRDQPGEDEMLRITGKPTETVRELIKELAR